MRLFEFLTLAPFLAFFPGTSSAPAAAPTTCNGFSQYCAIPYSNLTQIGAHDSPFVGALPTQNQHLSVADQLAKGVRFLQGQVQTESDGSLRMCHTSCAEENAGTLSDFFAAVREFLDAHPAELVTLLLVNGDRAPAAAFDDALGAADLKKHAFAGPSDGRTLALDAWPTVGDMLGAGQRCVVFLDAGADAKAFPQLLDEFSYFFETPYDVTSTDDFGKCAIDRPAGASPDGRMYIVNHFLDAQLPLGGIRIPDEMRAGTTNGPDSIQGQAGVCEGLYGRAPKGVLLDYVDQGDGLAWERQANGV